MSIHPAFHALLVASFTAGAVCAQAHVEVGPNVQVSRARGGDPHYEVLVAADPEQPGDLVVCSIVFPGGGARSSGVVYASSDGGETWRPTLAPALPDEVSAGDPACAFGPDGHVYYAVSVLPPGPRSGRHLLVYPSTDRGRTWAAPVRTTYVDRQYLCVDSTGGAGHGRVYLNGNSRGADRVSDLVLFRSMDAGATFAGPAVREGYGRFRASQMGNAVVLSDGVLAAVFVERDEDTSTDWLQVCLSTDGGAGLETAARVAPVQLAGGRKGGSGHLNTLPFLAVDSTDGPGRDRLYAVWPDRTSGHGEIGFSFSADRGRTWSEPRRIDDAGDATENFMPSVAVDRSGVVGVAWYDRRDHPGGLGWHVRFAASLDGGESFLPSVRVSEDGTSFDEWARRHVGSRVSRTEAGLRIDTSLNTFTFQGGDTAGLTADAAGVFHPVWVDNRTGTMQVWTAPVRVRATGRTSALVPTSELDDVTAAVTLEVLSSDYDAGQGTVRLRARLRNTSPDTLGGPWRARVIELSSALGEPAAVGADRGGAAIGAEWDFAGPADGRDALRPGEASGVRTLMLRIDGEQGRGPERGVLTLRTVIFARLVPR